MSIDTVLLIYGFASFVTFFLYAHDKRAAICNQWRVPEKTLHLASLFCGWPGALVAQQILRHKNRKTSFLVVFWVTVAVNVYGLHLLASQLVW